MLLNKCSVVALTIGSWMRIRSKPAESKCASGVPAYHSSVPLHLNVVVRVVITLRKTAEWGV